MSKFRKNHQNKYERTSFGVQSDPNDIPQIDQQPNRMQLNVKIASQPKSQYMNDTLRNVKETERCNSNSHIESKINGQGNKLIPFRTRKGQVEKNMKLQDKTINLDRNVYEISIGDKKNQENYLESLQQELSNLREKIKIIEGQKNEKSFTKTVHYEPAPSYLTNPNNYSEEKSKTIETRRPLCGKIYNRGQAPSSERKSRYSNKQQQSTYYKWRPQADQNEFSDFQSFSKEITINQKSDYRKNPEEISKTLTSYRVKQTSKRPQRQMSDIVQKKVATKDNQKHFSQAKVKIQKQVTKEVAEELKQVFQSNCQWQINSISDDFREKMLNKLQIPKGFPLDIPKVTDNLEEYESVSTQVYKLFKIDIEKCKQKPIIRRFKNGVYFQLKQNKNVVWYFNGIFYLGDWETELPSEGEKNGFGFEYIPNKYYYLGQFKDGMRNGKGTIKIINVEHPNTLDFTIYDGDWLNGKPHGYGKHIDEKSNKYMGNFQNGDKTGSGILLNRDGLYYEGQVKNGLKDGHGVEKLINGDTYIGSFVDGKFEGHGTYKWKNGSVYKGQFDKGKRQGRGNWKSYNGDEFDGEYSNDIKNGWGKFVWANGQIYEGQFQNDVRHGQGTYKHPSGKMGKFMWIEGQIDHRLYSKQEQHYRCRNINKKE